jgi:hypothetical protein
MLHEANFSVVLNEASSFAHKDDCSAICSMMKRKNLAGTTFSSKFLVFHATSKQMQHATLQ